MPWNAMKSNRTELTATELDEAGLGVGTVAGVRVHVADLLPGESAEVAIDHRSPHKPEAWGHVLRRLGEAARERTEPACPAFGRCGGCTWQHVAYPAQLEAKHRRVELALADILAIDQRGITVGPVRPSPRVLGYRNKGKYVVGRSGPDGTHVVFGAYAPRTHDVVDTLGCQVVAPIIDEVAAWARGSAESVGLVPYDEQTRTGELRYVIVREASGNVLVALVVAPRTPRAKLEKLANAMSQHPTLAGLVVIENDRRDGAIIPAGSSAQVLIGHGYLVEQLAGVSVHVGAGEFLQVNREQAGAMYERVAELAGDPSGDSASPRVAVDLFSGVGGIALHLARRFAHVYAVEIDEEAIAQLRRAKDQTSYELTAIAADAQSPGALADKLQGAHVVVVNPPRKGLTDAARELVVAIGAPTVIYVSCGPETLGRDLVALAEHGYMPDVIEPFDLMPGTGQVETVVRLRR
ncbi:MAG: 23S rRNA (uracil(1939)-C(5))-methyltransferase RlmD [Kofleriaceae bacterium]